jgi:hypothetical protein
MIPSLSIGSSMFQPMVNHLKYGRFDEQDSGKFVVVFANCNQEGRTVIVEGHTVWKSLHGYLPRDKFWVDVFLRNLFLGILGDFVMVRNVDENVRGRQYPDSKLDRCDDQHVICLFGMKMSRAFGWPFMLVSKTIP